MAEITKTERDRICEAYLCMAHEAKYRPAAPSDGCGNINLSPKKLQDEKLLTEEASTYADQFQKDLNQRSFCIGVPSWHTNRAFVYTIEAARLLCSDSTWALKLLEMATAEIKAEDALS